ncbi:methylmalonyl-CoA mutase C-terminal domain protein [Acididesulfobacillus acetoxydans]|uniref:Methylmalonyl-CoA mutase C-terminal domain protein n=1 Tax=Acididesulfobacillus acetoxydans TaxID=1561005 RepID=A0A8S0W8F5_9FIRM|nr:cobalamin B12-binding domain-containing protein [Acididesulfobacillus acetoxydans]CAA7601809.1 methylmalonyl-CoA mutase C-terminal domain protein [Acididesulfobacillus acetoxydans]CEJ09229.1 Protein Sbm [Acididesulfobacillus acetoxydans]
MEDQRRIRVLIGKVGLDGHDRGAKVIAQALRDAGMEVIYTGLRQTPAQIVEAALQEDVQAIGISILSGAHKHLLPKITELLAAEGAEDIPVIAGGVIPYEDRDFLEKSGIRRIFSPGTVTAEIVRFVQQLARQG